MFKRIDHVEIVPENAAHERGHLSPAGRYSNGDYFHRSPRAEIRNPWQTGYRGIALEVVNMAKTVDYLKGRGISITCEPLDLGDSYRGEIRGPDGLFIELRQWK